MEGAGSGDRITPDEELNHALLQEREAHEAMRISGLRRLAQSLREMLFICSVRVRMGPTDDLEAWRPPAFTVLIDSQAFGGAGKERSMEVLYFQPFGSTPNFLGEMAQRLGATTSRLEEIYDELNLSLSPLGRVDALAYFDRDQTKQSLKDWEKTWVREDGEPSAGSIARQWGWNALAAKMEARAIESGLGSGSAAPAKPKPKL